MKMGDWIYSHRLGSMCINISYMGHQNFFVLSFLPPFSKYRSRQHRFLSVSSWDSKFTNVKQP